MSNNIILVFSTLYFILLRELKKYYNSKKEKTEQGKIHYLLKNTHHGTNKLNLSTYELQTYLVT